MRTCEYSIDNLNWDKQYITKIGKCYRMAHLHKLSLDGTAIGCGQGLCLRCNRLQRAARLRVTRCSHAG